MLGKTNVKVKPNKKVDYVEYIESTGTQYINTGVFHDNNTKYEMQIKTTDKSSEFQQIFGARTMYNNSDAFDIGFSYGTKMFFNIGGKTNDAFRSSQINTIYTIEANSKNITVNGTNYSTGASSVSTCPYCDYVLAMNEGNVPTDTKFSGMLYYFKIYKGDALVRDFKPVKDGAGVYCLYDEVEKRIYYNQGSGSFIGGASI